MIVILHVFRHPHNLLARPRKCDSRTAFYTITMFIPIVVLTLLCPIGLILPVESGEKMGLQITLLLTLVVYIQILQETLPTFKGYHNSPVILNFFVVTIISCCTSILLSTWTLYLYHVESFEVWNYGRIEAKIRLFPILLNGSEFNEFQLDIFKSWMRSIS